MPNNRNRNYTLLEKHAKVILPDNCKAHYIKKRKESLRLGSNEQGKEKIPLPKTKRNPLGRLHRS